MAGETRRLRSNALHQIPVTDDGISKMIDDLKPRPIVTGRQMGFGDRHADAVAKALAERARGSLHTRRELALGMTRRAAPPLAKLLNLLERQVVPGEKQHVVEQHRTVTGR